MKKKTLSMLMVLAALILVVPAGIVDAKAAPQNIAFDLAGSWQEDGIDPGTGTPTTDYYDASVTLTGKISGKGGATYLTPLNGILALDGTEYKIQVKALKQSEPLYGQEISIPMPPAIGGYILISQTYGVIEANVEGGKFMGWLQWVSTTTYDADGNVVDEPSGASSLTLNGIVNGKLVSSYVYGDAPEIE